jgi:lipopolysaccharide export system protein LptA
MDARQEGEGRHHAVRAGRLPARSARAMSVATVLTTGVAVSVFFLPPPASASLASPVPVEITGATRVQVDDAAGVWVLEGSPVVVTRGTARVQAPSIRYEVRPQVVVATGGVTYTDPSGQVRAQTLTAWLVEERIRAEGDVVAVAAGRLPLELRAARADADRLAGVLVATGGVTVRRGELVLQAADVTYTRADQRVAAVGEAVVESAAGMLQADRMEALLAEDVLVADGRVRFRYQDITGTADRARLRQRERVAVLSGRATAQVGVHRISADVLTVDLPARRVTASGAAHLTVAAPP